jgi:two-component system sensor histidine kinase CpxA
LVKGQKRFLGDVAHELCSPLARLRTGLGILESRLPESELSRLAAIEDEARELGELIDEILAFSRATAGFKHLHSMPIDLRALIDEMIAREASHAHVECAVDGSIRTLADAKLLKRAMGNLLRNAIRYAGEDARIRVSASIKGGQVVVSVSDNGPGVPEAEIVNLFEPFYRPDSARTRENGGTGLGLTIVKSCIEACGGSVCAHNEKPSGFCVEMLLPLVTD